MLVRDLIKELQKKGYWLKREGKNTTYILMACRI